MKFTNSEEVWFQFRHIDLPEWTNTFDVIYFDWDLDQFLTRRASWKRNVLYNLIPIRLGYQSLMYIVNERNVLLQQAHQTIEHEKDIRQVRSDLYTYQNTNLESMISVPRDIRLREITDKYIEVLDQIIFDANKTFNILSKYIAKTFCLHTPLTLNVPTKLKQTLAEVIQSEEEKEKQK